MARKSSWANLKCLNKILWLKIRILTFKLKIQIFKLKILIFNPRILTLKLRTKFTSTAQPSVGKAPPLHVNHTHLSQDYWSTLVLAVSQGPHQTSTNTAESQNWNIRVVGAGQDPVLQSQWFHIWAEEHKIYSKYSCSVILTRTKIKSLAQHVVAVFI